MAFICELPLNRHCWREASGGAGVQKVTVPGVPPPPNVIPPKEEGARNTLIVYRMFYTWRRMRIPKPNASVIHTLDPEIAEFKRLE